MRIAAVVLTSVLGLVLAGCGSGDGDSAASKDPQRSKAKVADPKTAQMVAAVSSGSRAPGPVDLRFQLAGRPAVGQPVDVRFAITPQKDLENLYVKFSPGEGLDMSRGSETEHLVHPAIGVVIDHIVSVVPKADGIYYLTAVVVSDSDSQSLTRNYSIPIIAGAGVPEPPPADETRPESGRKSR